MLLLEGTINRAAFCSTISVETDFGVFKTDVKTQ